MAQTLDEFRASSSSNAPVLSPLDKFRLENPSSVPPEVAEPSSFKRGVGNLISPIGTALKNIGVESVGQSLQNAGDELVRANPSQTPDLASFTKAPLTYTKEAVVETAPQVITQAVLSGIGGIIGSRFGGAAGARIGAFGLGAVPTFLSETGGVLRSQEQNGQAPELGRAVAAGAANTAIEFTAGVQPLLANVATQLVGGKIKELAAKATVQGVVGGAVKEGVKAALGEAGEEIPQGIISDIGARNDAFSQANLTSDLYGASRAFLGSLPLGVVGGGVNQHLENKQIVAEQEAKLAPIIAERQRVADIASAAQADARARDVEVAQNLAKEGYYNTLAEQGDIVGIRFDNPKFTNETRQLAQQKIITRDTPVEHIESVIAKINEGKPLDLAVAETKREQAEAKLPDLVQQIAAAKEAAQPTADLNKAMVSARRDMREADKTITAFTTTQKDLADKVAAAANGTPEEFKKAQSNLQKFEKTNETNTAKALPALNTLYNDMSAVREVRRNYDNAQTVQPDITQQASAQPVASAPIAPAAETLYAQRQQELEAQKTAEVAQLQRTALDTRGEETLQNALNENDQQAALNAQPPLQTQLQQGANADALQAALQTATERTKATAVSLDSITSLYTAAKTAEGKTTTPAQAAAQIRSAFKGVDLADPIAVAKAITDKANAGNITFGKIAEANPDLVAPATTVVAPVTTAEPTAVVAPAAVAEPAVVTPAVAVPEKPQGAVNIGNNGVAQIEAPVQAPSAPLVGVKRWERNDKALLEQLQLSSQDQTNDKIIREDMADMRNEIQNAKTPVDKIVAIERARTQMRAVTEYNAQKAQRAAGQAAAQKVQTAAQPRKQIIESLHSIVGSVNSPIEASREATNQLLKLNSSEKIKAADLAEAQVVVNKYINFVYSENRNVTTPSTANAVADAFSNLFKIGTSSAFNVYETAADAIKAHPELQSMRQDAAAVVSNGKAFFIANNMQAGLERGTIMHELGSHLGIEKVLTAPELNNLARTIRGWSEETSNSAEHSLAVKALARVQSANVSEVQRNAETIAYFIEEAVNAGVDPRTTKATGKFGQLVRAVFAALKRVMTSLGINRFDNMSAQDIVDFAFGAAKIATNVPPIQKEVTIGVGDFAYSVPAEALGQGQAELNDLLNGIVLNDPSMKGVVSRVLNLGAKENFELGKNKFSRFLDAAHSATDMRRKSEGYRNAWDNMQDMQSASRYIQNETMHAIQEQWINPNTLTRATVELITKTKTQETQDVNTAISHLNKWNRDRAEPTKDAAAPWYKKVEAFRKAADNLLEAQKISELESLRRNIAEDAEYESAQENVNAHYERLKKEGYIPDRGRGPFAVGIYFKPLTNGEYPRGGDGLVKRFLFETEAEARNGLKQLKAITEGNEDLIYDTVNDRPTQLSQEALHQAQNNTTSIFQFFDLARLAGIQITDVQRSVLVSKLLDAESMLHSSVQNRKNTLGGRQDVVRALSEMAVNTSVGVSRARMMPRVMASLNYERELTAGERADRDELRQRFAEYSNVTEPSVRKTILEQPDASMSERISVLNDYNRMSELNAWGFDRWNGLSETEAAELDALRGSPGELSPEAAMRLLQLSTPKDTQAGRYNDQAKKLLASVIDPKPDALAGLRHIASLSFLGGSIASALTNLASIPLFLAPVLYGHSGFKAYSTLAGVSARVGASLGDPSSALGSLILKGDDTALRAALQSSEKRPKWMTKDMAESMLRAYEEGLIAEQQTYDLYALDKHGVKASSIFTHKASQLWMTPFRVAESIDRVVAFQAAYETGAAKGLSGKALYDFSREIVNDTMFVYGRLGRPEIARGPVGAALMTFRMFPLQAIELIAHMKGSQRTIMLGSLLLASGLNGIPGGDDLKDIIDTVMQRVFGKPFNSNRVIHNYLKMASEAMTGYDMADLLMNGPIDSLTGASMAARLSLGNLIPGTRAFVAGQDLARNTEEITGAVGSEVAGWVRGAESLMQGDGGKAWKQAVPSTFKRLGQLKEAIETGQITNANDDKVVDDITVRDEALLLFGFSLARQQADFRLNRPVADQVAFAKERKQQFRRELMEGMQSHDSNQITDTQEAIRTWNLAYPDLKIHIDRTQLIRDMREKGLSPTERNLKAIPREWRRTVGKDLQERIESEE